jgi:DNA repair exonuclease SbcCD nuclease subunit
MKVVHAADIHLDSPLRGLESYEGAPVDRLRGATRRALESLVELCLVEKVDLLLVAGDLYDGNWRDHRTGLFFAKQMSRLRAAAIPVVLLRGNHDALSQITRQLRLPDNVHELSTRRPETHVLEALGVAVHGQGFATQAVTDDLAARYPEAVPGLFNIGLLHTSLTGREGHAPYAPTTIETLKARGYDYWALGHVHRREVVCEDPPVVFAGNLQGRHARETGPKGATLLTVEGGRVGAIEHRALDVVRWAVCEVEARTSDSAEDVIDRARLVLEAELERAQGRPLAARMVLQGTTAAETSLRRDPERWMQELRAVANDIGGEGVWVEKIAIETRAPLDLEALSARDDAVGQLAAAIRTLHQDDAAISDLLEQLGDFRQKLPPEAREGEDGVRLDDAAAVRALLTRVEKLLVARILGGVAS